MPRTFSNWTSTPLAYVKDATGALRGEPGSMVPVPEDLVPDVIDSANQCPGGCIHVRRVSDGVMITDPDAA
jgi:ferredoxin